MIDSGSGVEARGKTLAERIGQKNVRRIAAVAIAAAGLLGLPETGVGVNVELPDPTTGLQVGGGVLVSSNTGEHPLGLSKKIAENLDDIRVYEVRLGNARVAVYTARLRRPDGSFTQTVGVYPSAETKLGK
ncbi:MAG: hypothetical protein HYY87_03640 [Candidatus Levybacteria bacterium]|nr:hypothetical protein [Candidatus Levybacteria bacterium]